MLPVKVVAIVAAMFFYDNILRALAAITPNP